MAYSNIDKPNQYFNTVLWTATGSAQTITGVGFNPDLVWNKARNAVGYRGIVDRVRGDGALLFSDATNAEDTSYGSDVLALENDGFSVQASTWSTNNYVTWNWLGGGTASSNTDGSITSSVSANTTSGFSIVSYTGTGSAATIGHGLGVAPSMIICKNRDALQNWATYHVGIGETKAVFLDNTDAAVTASSYWNNTAPTSTVFSVNTSGDTNKSGDATIAYCFAEKKGFSKFGSYTGNASTDGPMIYTGFKPAFVLLKDTSASNSWWIYDNKRDTFNLTYHTLLPDSSGAEETNTGYGLDFVSSGFKLRMSDQRQNGSGKTYIYMAFAESPLVGSNLVPNNAR